MGTMIDYLQWRGDLTFTQDPPNEVDALIFSGLSYIRYGDSVAKQPDVQIPLAVAAEEFLALPDREDRVLLKKDLELIDLGRISLLLLVRQKLLFKLLGNVLISHNGAVGLIAYGDKVPAELSLNGCGHFAGKRDGRRKSCGAWFCRQHYQEK